MAVLVLWAVSGFTASAQLRILPRSRVDSLVRAYEAPKEWSAAFLQFDSLHFNAGRVAENAAPICGELRFRNCSDGDILLGRVSTNCACISAEVRPAFVRRDSSAVIRFIYRQRGHAGRHPRTLVLHMAEPVDTAVASVVVDALVY